METPRTDTHRQKNTAAKKAANKCTDGEMFTLITTVQQIMTGVQTADTEGVRFTVIMRAVYGLVTRK